MDNRLTKRRLSDFLAYDWIAILILIAAAILFWELVFTVSATRLSVGQQFKFYFDEDVSTNGEIYDLLDDTFSYEVLSVEAENLQSTYNVLSVRLSVNEGDAIFTSSIQKEDGTVRAKTVIDNFPVYDLNELLKNAEDYLSQFKTGEELDDEKISAYFDKRMQGDKRFKTDEEKAQGRKDEIARIKKLASDVKDFETLLNSENQDLFYKYVRYEQASGGDENEENYGAAYKNAKEKGELIYGINLGALTGGKSNVSDYVKAYDAETESYSNVVLMIFDMTKHQPDLQYETISFTVTLVKEFSNILG